MLSSLSEVMQEVTNFQPPSAARGRDAATTPWIKVLQHPACATPGCIMSACVMWSTLALAA